MLSLNLYCLHFKHAGLPFCFFFCFLRKCICSVANSSLMYKTNRMKWLLSKLFQINLDAVELQMKYHQQGIKYGWCPIQLFISISRNQWIRYTRQRYVADWGKIASGKQQKSENQKGSCQWLHDFSLLPSK